ncbi:hypothetical protein RCL_jg13791.t1 [Rhizophagus clarus]|uniref:Uncharacterized protein n=1 Tax=Rhizophagus clarus TaxID=94130 RepID=A0A8H3MDU0_9GLOM|nr:hypothetical protein RCL_jg13791.t1 [Rhizophagus clarus]
MKTLHNSQTASPPSSQDPEKIFLPLTTNLFAKLNELELIAKNIKQLSVNVPDGIEDDAKQLNIEIAFILEKLTIMRNQKVKRYFK